MIAKTAWQHLPAAAYINRMFSATVRCNLLWPNSLNDNDLTADIWTSAWNAAIESEIIRAGSPVWQSITYQCHNIKRTSTSNGAWDAAAALIAWPELAYMMDSDPKDLELIYTIGDRRAVLFWPVASALWKEKHK